jgi:hypothetical protein
LYVKATSAITGLRLSDISLLIIIVAGFPAANVISVGLSAEFLVVLITLLSAMFLSLVKVALANKDAIAYAKPSILLHLNTIVFLNLD